MKIFKKKSLFQNCLSSFKWLLYRTNNWIFFQKYCFHLLYWSAFHNNCFLISFLILLGTSGFLVCFFLEEPGLQNCLFSYSNMFKKLRKISSCWRTLLYYKLPLTLDYTAYPALTMAALTEPYFFSWWVV